MYHKLNFQCPADMAKLAQELFVTFIIVLHPFSWHLSMTNVGSATIAVFVWLGWNVICFFFQIYFVHKRTKNGKYLWCCMIINWIDARIIRISDKTLNEFRTIMVPWWIAKIRNSFFYSFSYQSTCVFFLNICLESMSKTARALGAQWIPSNDRCLTTYRNR